MNNRTLGTIAMICASAMLIEALIPDGTNNSLVIGTASMVFMAGSFCSHVGLWRIAATGMNWWGRGVLAVQLFLVAMAGLFGFFEATGLVGEEHILFTITDLTWPLSMVWMLVVGITAAVVGRLRTWKRFAPLLCGLAFPVALVIGAASGLEMNSLALGLVFFGMLSVFWMVLGFAVRQSDDTAAAVEPLRAAGAVGS